MFISASVITVLIILTLTYCCKAYNCLSGDFSVWAKVYLSKNDADGIYGLRDNPLPIDPYTYVCIDGSKTYMKFRESFLDDANFETIYMRVPAADIANYFCYVKGKYVGNALMIPVSREDLAYAACCRHFTTPRGRKPVGYRRGHLRLICASIGCLILNGKKKLQFN